MIINVIIRPTAKAKYQSRALATYELIQLKHNFKNSDLRCLLCKWHSFVGIMRPTY